MVQTLVRPATTTIKICFLMLQKKDFLECYFVLRIKSNRVKEICVQSNSVLEPKEKTTRRNP